MINRKLLIPLALIPVIFLLGYWAINNGPEISVSPSSFDFGTIVQGDGPVSTTFIVENTGGEALTINRLSTSCGCTTAKMDTSDFKAGEQRTMSVTFDPRVHKDQTGLIERVVYLQTSDPGRPEVEIDIIATVIK